MKKNNLLRFIPIVILLAIGVGFSFAWWYSFSLVDAKVNSIKETKSQIKDAETKLSQRRTLNNFVEELNIKKQKIDAVFLSKDTLINLIEELEGAGRSAGVTLKIASSETVGNPVFSLSAEGDYAKVVRFLVLIENFPYRVDIQSFSMQEQGDAEKGTLTWRVDLVITLASYEVKI